MSAQIKRWSEVTGLRVHDIDSNTPQWFPLGAIPEKHLWAYQHILKHDCGSISCGRTIYEVTYREKRAEPGPLCGGNEPTIPGSRYCE